MLEDFREGEAFTLYAAGSRCNQSPALAVPLAAEQPSASESAAAPTRIFVALGMLVAVLIYNFLGHMHPGFRASDFCGLLCAVLGGRTDESDRYIACGLCLEGENAHSSPSTHSSHARRS